MVMPVIVIMGKVRILFVMNGDGCKNRFLSSYKMVNFLFGPPLKSDVKKSPQKSKLPKAPKQVKYK